MDYHRQARALVTGYVLGRLLRKGAALVSDALLQQAFSVEEMAALCLERNVWWSQHVKYRYHRFVDGDVYSDRRYPDEIG